MTMLSAKHWDNAFLNNQDFTALKTADMNFLLGYVSAEADVTALDIGCGTGQACRDLYHRGYDVLGVDMSMEAIEIAKASTVYLSKGIDFTVLDIEKQDLPGSHGLILCKYVFAFIQDKRAFLKKVKNAMESSSTFVMITPNAELLEAFKKHIGLPHDEVMGELSRYFTTVDYFMRNRDYYYICKR